MKNYPQLSTISPLETPTETPVVTIELQLLEKQMEELAQASIVLENRLGVAMAQSESDPLHKKDNVAPSLAAQSVLTEKIRGRVFEAELITRRLLSIIRRLEI